MKIRTIESLHGEDVTVALFIGDGFGEEPTLAGGLHLSVANYERILNLLDNTFTTVERGPCAGCGHPSHLLDACFSAVFIDGDGHPCVCGDPEDYVTETDPAAGDHEADCRADAADDERADELAERRA